MTGRVAGLLRHVPLVGRRFRDAGEPGQAMPPEAILLAVALFFAVAPTNILTPLLPNVRDDFGISIATTGLVVSTYGMARLLTDLPSGLILDWIGERRLAVAGSALLTGGSIVGAISPTVGWLIVARVAAGLGSGLITTVALTGLSWTAGRSNRGAVMSLFQVANNSGIAFYPLAGGLLGAFFSWRVTFVLAAVAGVAAAAILLPLLGRIETGQKRAATSGPGRHFQFRLSRPRLVGALGATYAGVFANMTHRHGFRNTVLPLFAAAALGLGSFQIATGIALMSIVGIIVVTPGSRLGDRIGRRRIIVAGLLVLAAGDLTFLGANGYLTFLLAAGLVGLGDFFSSTQTALLSELVSPASRARVLAGYRFFVDIGALLGPLVLSALLGAFSPAVAIVGASAILASGALISRLGIPPQPASEDEAASLDTRYGA